MKLFYVLFVLQVQLFSRVFVTIILQNNKLWKRINFWNWKDHFWTWILIFLRMLIFLIKFIDMGYQEISSDQPRSVQINIDHMRCWDQSSDWESKWVNFSDSSPSWYNPDWLPSWFVWKSAGITPKYSWPDPQFISLGFSSLSYLNFEIKS